MPGSEIVALANLILPGTHPLYTRAVVHLFRVKRISGDTITAIGHFGKFHQRLYLSMQDRGVTWAPAWRESERRAFESACALR